MSEGIQIRGLTKRYGSTVALNGLDLEIAPGEILGVAGPNGAGKSTLVRMIGGEESPTSGSLKLDGQSWSPTDNWDIVSIVHQEPQLFPNLTVAENMVAGREGAGVGWPKPSAADLQIMEALGLGAVGGFRLGDCSLAMQQRAEIARAVARQARIFLFDEPNSALTPAESDELFREMHALAASGRIVVLITHRLGDLVKHCARVAVVRDGRVRAELAGEALSEEALARQLVTDAAAVAHAPGRAAPSPGGTAVAFSVRNWSSPGAFRDVDFSAEPGEIVALIGVEGSGARELLRSFGGLESCTGEIVVAGVAADALERSRCYVPATRASSLYGNFSVGENLLVRLGIPEIANAALALKKRRMAEIVERSIRRFLVKTPRGSTPIRSLSGGNQQKVAIAQALNRSPQLLLLEEPTRGVDIHSKNEIYHLLGDYAATSKLVIVFCTEVLEVFEMADSAYVVRNGRISPRLKVADFEHVETLATAIARLEQEAPAAA